MRIRFFLVLGSFVLLYGLLVFNLYAIQIRDGERYVARAESQLENGKLVAPRGSIFFSDREGGYVPAAIDKKYYEVYAVPTEIEDAQEAAEQLATIADISAEELKKSLNKSGDQYELLIKRATDEQLEKLAEINLAGVYARLKAQRFYPLAMQAAHLLGYVSEAGGVGEYGAERQYEERLAGESGIVDGDKVVRAVPGIDLYLTIDRNIQSQAEDILDNLVKKYRADGGTILVQEPKSGRLLAMVSRPTFDPNGYSGYSIGSFLNPAVEGTYEPGSIFKVITMAAGIDSGAITPKTTYYDSGTAKLNGETIHNWDLQGHGTITMTEVIEGSVNTGTVFAERQMGHKTFFEYLQDFELNSPTEIDLPGEVAGSFGALVDRPRDINFATASFGQGISVTPIGLLRAVSALANGGLLQKPIIEVNEQPQKGIRVIQPETAKQVTEMMVSAVDKAIVAHIPGYTVAGKTGTAQVPDLINGGYTHDVINSYAGYAPAYDPAFVILVKLDRPEGAPLAGQTVVPAFKELAQFILNYYSIPPDRIE